MKGLSCLMRQPFCFLLRSEKRDHHNTNIPLKALTNLLARYFADQGGRRRQAGACQGVQQRYAEYNAINVNVF